MPFRISSNPPHFGHDLCLFTSGTYTKNNKCSYAYAPLLVARSIFLTVYGLPCIYSRGERVKDFFCVAIIDQHMGTILIKKEKRGSACKTDVPGLHLNGRYDYFISNH
jgi:hypothetical protein